MNDFHLLAFLVLGFMFVLLIIGHIQEWREFKKKNARKTNTEDG